MGGVQEFPSPARGLLERPRLEALLEGTARLTAIRAPGGFGKRTLVAQWAAKHAEDFTERIWLRPESAAELAEIAPAARGARRLVVIDVASPGVVDEGFLDRLAGSASQRAVVLASSELELPDHWIALLGAPLIDADRLAFTEEECAEMLGVDTHRSAEVLAATAGWPALVRLVTTGPGSAADPTTLVDGYLEERLAELAPAARALAEDSSVLERFSASDIASIVRTPEAAVDALAAGLEQAGLATRRGTPTRPVWQLIPIFRRSVLARVEREDLGRYRELQLAAARLALANGDSAAATRHALRASDWPLVIEILDDHWYRLFTEHSEVVREVALHLPEHLLADRPDLRFGRDVALAMSPAGVLTRTVEADRYDPITAPTASGSADGNARAALIRTWRRLSRARRAGDYARAMRVREEFGEQLSDADPAVVAANRDLLPLLYLQWAVTAILAGDDEIARADLRLAFETPAQRRGEFAQRNAAGDLALLAATAGDVPNARVWLERATSFAPIRGYFARAAMYGERVATAMVALESLELDAAREALAVTATSFDRDELWAYHLLAKSRLAILEHTEFAMLTQLDATRRARARQLGPAYLPARLVAVAETELLLAIGAPLRAGAVISAADDHPLVRAARAVQLLQLGELEAAAEAAGAAIWAPGGGPSTRATACLVRATAALRLGREHDAVVAFRLGRGLIDEFGLRRILGSVPRVAVEELVRLTGLPLDLTGVPELYPPPVARADLSERELVLLTRLVDGTSLDRIARSLHVSRNTLKTQAQSLYRKLGVHGRDDAIAEGRRQGFFDDPA